jgi:uroporphyrinogen decarboxylase
MIRGGGMTCKERVIETINHKETDTVPYSILFTPDEKAKMAAFYNDPGFEDKLGNHFAYLDIRPPKQEIKPHFFRDEFGVVWNRTEDRELGVVDEYLVSAENVETFAFPDPADPVRYEKCGLVLDKYRDKFVVAKYAHALFERAWTLYGMESLMCDMILQPKVVERLYDRITEYFLDLLDCIAPYEGVDCVHYGDDWGQQHGLIMGPKLWRTFIKPRMKEIYQKAKGMGKYVYIHTCGDIQEIIPDMIEIGVDIYDPFQPEVFDIYEMKKQYGKDITFFGGISLQHTLPFGTVKEVMDETAYKARVLSKGGGYIVAPSHAITRDVPVENVDAMMKVLKNQRDYI